MTVARIPLRIHTKIKTILCRIVWYIDEMSGTKMKRKNTTDTGKAPCYFHFESKINKLFQQNLKIYQLISHR